MPAPIVPRPRAVVVLAVLGLTLVLGLGELVRGARHGLVVDDAISRWIHRSFGADARHAMLNLTEPALVISLLAVLALGALVARRLDVAVLVALGPAVTCGLTEYVLKPWFHRTNPATTAATGQVIDAYPSGHQALVASFVVVGVLLTVRAPLRRPVRAALVLAAVGYAVLAAAGLVGYFFHYPTDTVGSLGLAVFVVLGGALALDAYSARGRRRHSRAASRSAAGPC